MPQVDNVVEVSWAESPIMRTTIAAADYLRNDDHKTIIENSAGRLRKGRRLLIFPEGSRSPAGSLHPFQRGAARIALASGSDILPVIIQCDPPVGTKGTKWYDVPDRRPRMAVRVVPPLSPQQHLDGTESPGVAARKVTAALQELYARELGHEDA
jgi:1-acyl-sn-glycerol-3-phosphate acyltransferase